MTFYQCPLHLADLSSPVWSCFLCVFHLGEAAISPDHLSRWFRPHLGSSRHHFPTHLGSWLVCLSGLIVCHNLGGGLVCHNFGGLIVFHNLDRALVCHNLVGLIVFHSLQGLQHFGNVGLFYLSQHRGTGCFHTLMQCPVLSKRLLVKVWIESDWPEYQVCSSLRELVPYGLPVSAWGIGWGGSHFSLWVDPPLKWV